MEPAPVPEDEARRLATLRSLDLLDTPPEERFDRVTRLAQRLFDVPIALISLVDADRQWFKSNQGLDAAETSRRVAFCSHAILDAEVFSVPDATVDDRFADNPLVTDDPSIRFYAGVPIQAPDGSRLGTLCVIDRSPRDFTPDDGGALADLAAMVEQEIASTGHAITDELTGLTNRRGFMTLGTKALNACKLRGHGALLAFFDIDDFKPINDTHGHEVGDAMIKALASVLADVFRGSDVIARLGGDEFAVLMTSTTEFRDIGGRLRAGLDATKDIHPEGQPLSVSIGLAALHVDDDVNDDVDLNELVRRADADMYEHKARRR